MNADVVGAAVSLVGVAVCREWYEAKLTPVLFAGSARSYDGKI